LPEPTLKQLFTSSEDSNVTFVVDEKKIHAHKFVLRSRCSLLYDLCKDSKDGSICLPDVGWDTFNDLLRFVYTVDQPKYEDKDLEHATLLLKAADRFGVTQLKLYVESEIVSKILNAGNAASLMLFADANSCALLKEATFKKYFKDTKKVRKSEDWEKMKKSADLLDELLQFGSFWNQKAANNSENESEDVENVRVGTLRDRLQNAQLDIDGKREMLVKRWKEHLSKLQDVVDPPL
jgi:hypothetical protein